MEQLTVVKNNSKCHFCGVKKNDYLRYGPTYKLGRITAHYYCVLLSNSLIQNGKDNEGILGFLLHDIKAELSRTSNILCIYCKKGNATITCSAPKCRRQFHLPCGLKNGSSHQFVDQFKSFCHLHRLFQNIPRKILREACENKVICCICQETVVVEAKHNSDILWAPCCLKTWYHKNCVQKLAHSAGYFCRCPACNDSKKFNEWIQNFGIFIPKQDASWELAPNAFSDLLFRYNNCDAEECKCPEGRQSNTENTMWEIILCESCGSQGIHVACGNLKFLDPEWECGSCSRITDKMKSSVAEVSGSDVGSSKPELGQKKRRRNSEDMENSVLDKRKKCRTSVEEEDIEIDVETVDEEAKDETPGGGHDEADSDRRRDLVSPPLSAVSSEPSAKSQMPAAPENTRHLGIAAEEAATTTTTTTTTTTAAAAAATTTTGTTKTTTRKNDPQEVFSIIKPGPLSYKLSTIRKMLGDFTIPKRRREIPREKDKAAKSSSPTAVIELSDSDSDIEIIDEMTAAEERSRSISHHRRDEREQRREPPATNKEGTKHQFSLQDFEVIAVVSLQPAEEADNSKAPTNEVLEKAVSSNYFPESVGANCQKTAAREDKELLQAVDDDVIILTD